jgi:hypothetical protein
MLGKPMMEMLLHLAQFPQLVVMALGDEMLHKAPITDWSDKLCK